MGQLCVWAVAAAALLGTWGRGLAEGHTSSRRGGVDAAGVVQELHSRVKVSPRVHVAPLSDITRVLPFVQIPQRKLSLAPLIDDITQS